MQAECELIADFQALSSAIQADVKAGAGFTTWKARREQIAELRERVRTMRNRHLGECAPTQQAPPASRSS